MERLFGKFMALFLLVSLSVGFTNASDLSSGLIGHWPLDGNAKDIVGGSDGKLVGGSDWVDSGRVNGAVECDGSTGYVEISGFTPLVTNTLTSVAWINGWRQSAWTGIVVSRADPVTFWMGFTDQDTLSYIWNNNSDQTWGWVEGPVISENEWAMVAVAIEPDKATSYVYTDADGLKEGVNNIDHIEQTVADNLKFGWDECCGPDRHFQGIIDEVMIYDRALRGDEVVDLATSGLAVVSLDNKLTTTWGKIKQ